MSPFYYSKRKYSSLIASSTLHGLILLLLMLCLDQVKNLIDPLKTEDGLKTLSRSTPASVSFATSTPQQINIPKQPVKMASPDLASPNANKELKASSAIAKKTKKIIEKIKIVKENKFKQEIKEAIKENFEAIQKEVIDKKIEEPITTPNNILPYHHEQPQNKKNKITGAQLVQAFRQAYRSEESYSANNTTTYNYGDSSETSTEEYVNQRLSEWKYASYNTRVNESLSKAFRIHSSPIYFEESIYTQIIIDFILNKQGKIVEVNLVKPTGYKPLDEYIVDIIKKSQFAPIPDHLETSLYKFRHSPFVRIEKGSHTVVYSYSGNV